MQASNLLVMGTNPFGSKVCRGETAFLSLHCQTVPASLLSPVLHSGVKEGNAFRISLPYYTGKMDEQFQQSMSKTESTNRKCIKTRLYYNNVKADEQRQ